jgi:hypothetical protein
MQSIAVHNRRVGKAQHTLIIRKPGNRYYFAFQDLFEYHSKRCNLNHTNFIPGESGI